MKWDLEGVVINKKFFPCTPGEKVLKEISSQEGEQGFDFYTNLDDAMPKFDITLVPSQEAGTPSPVNPLVISGESELKITQFGESGSGLSEEYTIALGQTVYGGAVDVISGVMTVTFAMVQVKTLNWTAQFNLSRLYTTDLQGLIDVNELVVCEFAKSVPWDNVWVNIPLDSISVASSGNIFFKTTDYTDKETFLADLGDYYICYPLLTPTTVQLTATQIKTFKKHTNRFRIRGRYATEASYYTMEGGACDTAKQFLPLFYNKERRSL